MTDFSDALAARLKRNAELAAEREQFEAAEREQRLKAKEAEAAAEAEATAAREARHAELVEALTSAAQMLKAAEPESFIVRLGYTESRREFIAKLSTRLVEPSRSLFIELDRDDDEVLVRWHTAVGNALELWRLLEVDADLINELILQVADQELWRHRGPRDGPPAFPGTGA